ncbi:DnaJ homolog subfamily C member 17 [Tanacetum coccineum]
MVVIFIDHYTVLGLPTGDKGLNLSSKDIKKAYKLKALELHPDKKPNNPNAVADFQKHQASFDILKDEYASTTTKFADFQKLQASFNILEDESARKVFNHELVVRLRERGEQFVESVVEDSCEFDDVDSFVKRMVAEMRKRKRADEFEEMRRRNSEKREKDRMSSEYEKRYSEDAPNFEREEREKKIRREANVYRDIKSIREIYAKRSAYTLFYDILRQRKGEIYV